jgi:hypothetical protein
MTIMDTEAAPRLHARIAGFLYVIVIGAGAFAEFFARSSLMVRGNAAATAANIHNADWLFRMGLIADCAGCAAYVAITAILYYLFKPVSRTVSLMAAFFSLTGCAIMAANLVNHIAQLLLLGNDAYLHAFTPAQLDVLALTALRLHARGYALSMIFFGCYCILIGVLILRSTFMPRIIGVLMALAGLSAIATTVGIFLAIDLPDTGLLGLLGEGSLALWLLLFGVNAPKWKMAQLPQMGTPETAH